MIGRIQGKLLLKQAPDIMIDVNGVGYELFVPMTTYYQLPEVGTHIQLHTHFVVREDAQILYGFLELDDRHMFRQLIRVNGVGPKMALAILSGMNINEFAELVVADDVTGLTKIPGVGKKTAERLIIEMRDRIKQMEIVDLDSSIELVNESTVDSQRQHEKDAIAALVALGYSPQQASKSVSKVVQDSSDSEQMIRKALKSM